MTYSRFLNKIGMPIIDRIYGTHFTRDSKFLDKSQWWSETNLKAYQNLRLRKLVKHSYEYVPYYHDLFKSLKLKPDDIKTVNDLNKLPLLTKRDISDNFDRISAVNVNENKYNLVSSGGTTGETLVFKEDKRNSQFARAAKLHGWKMNGYNLGDKYAELWSHPVKAEKTNVSRNFLQKNSKLFNLGMRRLFLNTYITDRQTILNYVQRIKNFKPKFIRGYPSAIHIMSKFVDNGEIEVDKVFTTAETLTSEAREEISKKFQCDIVDGYGGEAGADAVECPAHEGYHIMAQHAITEFLMNKESVSAGELGEIVLTDLNNYSMPFIRYKIGDLGVPSNHTCSCGRGLPMMERIEGRVKDIIMTPSGRILTRPTFFGSGNLKHIKGLIDYQVVQEKIDKVVLRVKVGKDYSERSEKVMLTMAEDLLGEDVDIKIKEVKDIPLASSGKRQIVVSRINHEFN